MFKIQLSLENRGNIQNLFSFHPLGIWDPAVEAPGHKYSEVPGKGDEGRDDDEGHHCVDQVEDHQVHSIRGDGALVPVALNIAKKGKRMDRAKKGKD